MIQILVSKFHIQNTFFVFGCDAEAQEEESPTTAPTAQDNPVTSTT